MTVVKLENVSVSYYLPKGVTGAIRGNVSNRLKGFSGLFLREISVLKNISISFEEGQRIGLVGINGTGKSTLLKLIAGSLVQSEGSIEVNGRIASVLSLGGGMVSTLTGESNAVLKYYGAKKPRMSLKDFLLRAESVSGLGEYFKMPVSTYSSGMKSRLDRVMLDLIEGEIFLFDEWVVLGDGAATSSANNKKMLGSAKLVVLASHSESLLREWTDELIWLDGGGIREFGPIDEVLPNYQKFVKEMKRDGS
jgi:ABC-type polysaccharide/polyol phosphate transport system ATPase subunit